MDMSSPITSLSSSFTTQSGILGSLWAKVDKMPGITTPEADFDRVVSVWPQWLWNSLGGCCLGGGERHWLRACTPSQVIL